MGEKSMSMSGVYDLIDVPPQACSFGLLSLQSMGFGEATRSLELWLDEWIDPLMDS